MVLNEKNSKDKIDHLTLKDWSPLLALIPEIENTSSFGEGPDITTDKEGVIQISFDVPRAPIVSQFIEVVYAIPVIIDFDWGSWDAGRKMARDDNFNFDTTDLHTKCKLITAIVRNDRFCEGALVSAFESGLILKILKSIEKDVISIG